MILKDLILFGAGGHARACIDVIEQEQKFQIVGLISLSEDLGSIIHGYKVIAIDENIDQLAKDIPYALIAIGQIGSPEKRINLHQKVLKAGFDLATIISPNAYISPRTRIGPGTIVMHGATLNSGVEIGKNCIINSRALIEHDSIISSHCHISTGVIINGDVKIGEGSFVGSGAVLREGISVGKRTSIGMGITVRQSLADNVKYLGTLKN